MPIDFNNIQTTRGRGYDANMISRLNTQPNPTVIKQDIVDAVMAIPTAIAKGMDKAVTFGKSMFPQTSQKGSPNKKDNTMRWAEGGFMSYYVLLLIKNIKILYVANNK